MLHTSVTNILQTERRISAIPPMSLSADTLESSLPPTFTPKSSSLSQYSFCYYSAFPFESLKIVVTLSSSEIVCITYCKRQDTLSSEKDKAVLDQSMSVEEADYEVRMPEFYSHS